MRLTSAQSSPWLIATKRGVRKKPSRAFTCGHADTDTVDKRGTSSDKTFIQSRCRCDRECDPRQTEEEDGFGLLAKRVCGPSSAFVLAWTPSLMSHSAHNRALCCAAACRGVQPCASAALVLCRRIPSRFTTARARSTSSARMWKKSSVSARCSCSDAASGP